MNYALAAYIAIAACAVLVSGALVLSAWEHRRFMRRRRAKRLGDGPWPRAMVFAPCRGVDLGLEENLRPLLVQRYPDYKVAFIVESEHDPACEVIRRLIARHPEVPSRLVFAGEAVDSGQKVHNLIVATGDLPGDVEVLAFVDSDARPHPDWLSRLVERVRKDEVGAATGYRWFVPDRGGLANLLLSSINANVAGLMGPHWHNRVWGGSWAIRRETFDHVQLRRHWKGTLSDDLVASRLLHAAGLKVAFEPHCLVASPVAMTTAAMLEFMRRQFVVGRFYARRLWLTSLAVSTLGVAAFWGGIVLAAWWLATRQPWAWVPLAGSALLYALSAVRAWLRQDGTLVYFPKESRGLRRAARFDIWAAPMAQFVAWCGLLASLVGRRIVWRGISYRLGAGGRVQIEATPSVVGCLSGSGKDRRMDQPGDEGRRVGGGSPRIAAGRATAD